MKNKISGPVDIFIGLKLGEVSRAGDTVCLNAQMALSVIELGTKR